MFGESAGAVMTAIQLLNPDISKFARAAVRWTFVGSGVLRF